MHEIKFVLNDDDYSLLKEAADSEYRTVECYLMYLATIKAKKQRTMNATCREKRRQRAALQAQTA